jgi:lipopolysaccharide export LptBFGC system permease protein LptF
VIAIVYFLFIIVADTFRDKPSAMPHLLMWLPNIIFIGLGLILFLRLSRK